MKYPLLVSIVIFMSSCHSDDSDYESQDHAPSGSLIKMDIYYPKTDVKSSNTYFYNRQGKVSSTLGESWSLSEYAQYTTSFSYNANGQIWKSSTEYEENIDYTEFIFENDLITTSLRHRSNGDILRTVYSYNADNQLISKQHFNADNEAAAVVTITFNTNGNIEHTHSEPINGDIKDHTYEYDIYNNPQASLFENQELSKVVGNSFNNITNTILTRNYNQSTEINIEYTYNAAGYPLTSKEYMYGDLETQVTYTYQE
ncbi:hypothetical protein OS188_12775 [Xanthomarina sp. F1114]|uniref:hypothetical protein n=1 Tax=Xanthomarina sp. F1114 TaxID=2996019 RepID=UPI00225DD4F8|nr:hypothetical protein [Xanthomarina sp. F1114]MCX7548828.1 hypothetical protein [Xanthomarina sp. F1114]